MSISAQAVKDLREKTGAGMMDCKKALSEANGNFEAAVEFLKKQGLAKAVKKGDRVAAEGLIFSKVEGSMGLLLELNCETDFVSKNEDFLKLGNKLAELIAVKKPANAEIALALPLDDKTVQDVINENISLIGEKLSLRRTQIMNAKDGGKIALYNHAGGRIAVLVEIKGDKVTEELCRDVAMHAAAMNPAYLTKSDVPADVLAKEKAIKIDQLRESGKPENMLEKIVQGQLDKFASEMSLSQQIFVKDPAGKKTVEQHVKDVDSSAKIVQFVRFAVGEGIEKKVDDFAEEVKRMAQ